MAAMDQQTKFGYAFLFLGVGLPYWIDKMFGPVVAVVIEAAFVLGGFGFLVAAHTHSDEKREGIARTKNRKWLGAVLPLILLCASVFVGWWIMTHSDMEADIVGSATGEWEELQPSGTVSLNIDVINNGIPSITKNWTVATRLRNGEVFQGKELVSWISVYADGDDKTPLMEFHPQDFIDQKTASTPVPSGGRVRGVMAVAFPGIPREKINEQDTEVILTFEDSRSRKATTIYKIPTKVDVLVVPHKQTAPQTIQPQEH